MNSELFGRRLRELIDKHAAGNRLEFAKRVDIHEATIRKYERGDRIPKIDVIEKIVQTFPEVDIQWLLGMERREPKEEARPVAGLSLKMVPLVDQYAHAGGYLSGFADPEYIDELPKVPFPVEGTFRGKYLAFEIRGDSMYDGTSDGYAEGEIALGREVKPEYWRNKLHTHKWRDYIIVHKEHGVLIKRIQNQDVNTGDFEAKSLNPDFDSFRLNFQDVVQLFNVIKTIKPR